MRRVKIIQLTFKLRKRKKTTLLMDVGVCMSVCLCVCLHIAYVNLNFWPMRFVWYHAFYIGCSFKKNWSVHTCQRGLLSVLDGSYKSLNLRNSDQTAQLSVACSAFLKWVVTMPHSVASVLGLHCLLRAVCLNS